MTRQKESSLEYILTNSHKDDLIVYIKTHPNKFNELIKLSISDKQPYAWRAAWLLWSCMDKNDRRIHKHIKNIIYKKNKDKYLISIKNLILLIFVLME